MLKLSRVCAGYGGVDVIHDISFDMDEDLCPNLSIIGPNGCGKTTLLKVIANLLPHKGDVEIEGVLAKSMKPRVLATKVALLGQISPVYFSYSVLDTVLMGRYAHCGGLFGGFSRHDKEIAEDCLAKVNLLDVRRRSLATLSGGQLQRVFLARTLAQDPQIILLDEPTNHLDLKFQLELIDYLKEWGQGKNRCIIGVLHDISLAMRLSKNIMVMQNGKIAACGKIIEALTSSLLQEVYGMDVAGAMRENLKMWEKI